jgi:putative SOS response-associated peptidase YedK
MGHRVTKEQFITLKEIEKEFGVDAALELVRSGFEYSDWPIIKATDDKKDIIISKAHWEFIPPWIKDGVALKAARKQGVPWLNATSEKLLDSKMFRDAALNRRCLVVASHFYEWRHYKPDGEKKEIAYPYAVEVPEQPYFYMAGIWQPWTDKETGEVIDTFAIVTTKANDLMEVIHNKKKRMPTILPEDLAYEWIMNELTEQRIKEIASYQLPSEYMFAYTIAKDFRTAENPLETFEYEALPDLDLAL